jgi:hypothetical protein
MNVQVTPATSDDRARFTALVELYVYDFREIVGRRRSSRLNFRRRSSRLNIRRRLSRLNIAVARRP